MRVSEYPFKETCTRAATIAVDAGFISKDTDINEINDKLYEILEFAFDEDAICDIDASYPLQLDALHFMKVAILGED